MRSQSKTGRVRCNQGLLDSTPLAFPHTKPLSANSRAETSLLAHIPATAINCSQGRVLWPCGIPQPGGVVGTEGNFSLK